MEITKIILNSQGDYRVNIKSDKGRMIAMFLSSSSANVLIRDTDGKFGIYKDGSDTVYEFVEPSEPNEPQLWYDEDLTPSDKKISDVELTVVETVAFAKRELPEPTDKGLYTRGRIIAAFAQRVNKVFGISPDDKVMSLKDILYRLYESGWPLYTKAVDPDPKPLPNTFTWEEMDDAFQAGANYGAAEPGTRPDFGAFMDGLGLSRSKS